jgi:hypothetical protein
MARCGAPHPEDASRTCIAKVGIVHDSHWDKSPDPWPNVEVQGREAVQKRTQGKGIKRDLEQLANAGAEAIDQFRGGSRPINIGTKEEGMAEAATSRESEDFRRLFFLTMVEVATVRQEFSTNDVWDLLESRGYSRSRNTSAQATGTVGPSGCSLGLWGRTGARINNSSGNGHSIDNKVRVYTSRILGNRIEDHVPQVDERLAELREKARERASISPEGAS